MTKEQVREMIDKIELYYSNIKLFSEDKEKRNKQYQLWIDEFKDIDYDLAKDVIHNICTTCENSYEINIAKIMNAIKREKSFRIGLMLLQNAEERRKNERT